MTNQEIADLKIGDCVLYRSINVRGVVIAVFDTKKVISWSDGGTEMLDADYPWALFAHLEKVAAVSNGDDAPRIVTPLITLAVVQELEEIFAAAGKWSENCL